jgi:hypothetical protein
LRHHLLSLYFLLCLVGDLLIGSLLFFPRASALCLPHAGNIGRHSIDPLVQLLQFGLELQEHSKRLHLTLSAKAVCGCEFDRFAHVVILDVESVSVS